MLVKFARLGLLLIVLAIGLAACRGRPQPRPTATVPVVAATETPFQVALQSTSTPAPTREPPTATIPSPTSTLPPTATPTPTATMTDAPTATPTATPTPTPTPTPLHPLSIAAMRKWAYPGSDLVIEQTLAPGSNYRRYIVSYRSEGLKIYALLTVPNGQKPATGWPVIIFNHGYIPPAQYRTTERYVAYVDAFARSGYIVFRSDYRGHGSSEGVASGAYAAPDYTVDVLNAVATMKMYKDADPNRIGMWGHSMGGSITLRAMVTVKDIKAGVIWAGVVASYPDLLERWRRLQTPTPAVSSAGRRWREELIAQYGTPEQNPAFYASISPNSYLADLSGPIQLHHGTADASVPVEFSETLYKQIQSAGKMVEYYAYQGDNHNISNGFTPAMQRSIAFFDQYVKGPP
ncbi:MAG: alpha/beta fold hydrolase [Anaerolineae bacterium]|nr:alpha/beta fold hydrolase [Anaerolineae bacterium]